MSALCMEPASEARAGMAGDEASCDPPPPAAVPPPPPPAAPPPPPPPASSSASSKRRWSPSTWRYAIEDSQAELPSRPRPTAPLGIAAAPPSSRPLHSSPPQQPFKSKPPSYNPLYGKAAEEPHRGTYASRTQTMVDAHVRSSPSQLPAGGKTRVSEVNRKSNHHLHNFRGRSCENGEDEEDENDAEQEDHDADEDDQAGPAMYDDEYFKRRRREMSPSELYFCEICSERAAGSKGTVCAYRDA